MSDPSGTSASDPSGTSARVLLVAGTTRTAAIEGITAAGADPAAAVHTPGADAELLAYGDVIRAPRVPVSPTGCPTPAIVTRAARELLGFAPVVVDAGLAAPTAAPTVDLGVAPGDDVRVPEPVPGAGDAFERARRFAAGLPADRLVIGETIPGGTTTALGVLTALGERRAVSSSLPENPLALKRETVDAGLDASGLEPGDAAGDPEEAVRTMGDPVLGVVAGLVAGASEAGTAVTLGGGTQLAAAAALARHAGLDAPLELATTRFLADDPTAEIRATAADLDLDLTVTDPGFESLSHPAAAAYLAGEAKEGACMGGALALVAEAAGDAGAGAGVGMTGLRDRLVAVYDRVCAGRTA